MKKLYLYAFTVSAFISTTKAQDCPGSAFATPILSGGTCRVIVQNMPPNAPLLILNANGENITIGPASTNAQGAGSAFYNCNSSPSVVSALTPTGTCFANIAPAIVLPVKLSSYNVRLMPNRKVALEWSTSFELNSYAYVIQKSTNGSNWTNIGNVAASENSTATIRYRFDDNTVLDGAAYYRLEMVDIDGTKTWSKAVYVNNRKGGNTALSVFPNPFRSDVQLVGISSADVNRNNIRLYTITGKEVPFKISGANAITIDAGAPKGIYILRVMEKTIRLVKE